MPDVTIREASAEDLEATYDVVAACNVALYGKPEFTLEHLRSTWDLWTGFTAWEGERAVGTSAVRGDDLVVFVRPRRGGEAPAPGSSRWLSGPRRRTSSKRMP